MEGELEREDREQGMERRGWREEGGWEGVEGKG